MRLEPRVDGGKGPKKVVKLEGKESKNSGPVPLKTEHMLRNEGAAFSASRAVHRNRTQRKLDPNPSFTVSSGALG